MLHFLTSAMISIYSYIDQICTIVSYYENIFNVRDVSGLTGLIFYLNTGSQSKKKM